MPSTSRRAIHESDIGDRHSPQRADGISGLSVCLPDPGDIAQSSWIAGLPGHSAKPDAALVLIWTMPKIRFARAAVWRRAAFGPVRQVSTDQGLVRNFGFIECLRGTSLKHSDRSMTAGQRTPPRTNRRWTPSSEYDIGQFILHHLQIRTAVHGLRHEIPHLRNGFKRDAGNRFDNIHAVAILDGPALIEGLHVGVDCVCAQK